MQDSDNGRYTSMHIAGDINVVALAVGKRWIVAGIMLETVANAGVTLESCSTYLQLDKVAMSQLR